MGHSFLLLRPPLTMAPKKDAKSSKTPSKAPPGQEEGRRWWWQGQEEEVVQGKVRDKLNNLVLFDQATYDKLLKEVPAYKLITPAVVSERLKIRGSLARKALNELQQKGLIKCVVKHRAQLIYTRTTKVEDAAAA